MRRHLHEQQDWSRTRGTPRVPRKQSAQANAHRLQIVNFYLRAADAKAAGRDWFINSRKLTYPEPPIDARNILRPETAESLFVAYRVTGDPIYRSWVRLLRYLLAIRRLT